MYRKINKKSVSFDAESANIHDENVVIKQIASIEQVKHLLHYYFITTENPQINLEGLLLWINT